MSNCGHLGLLVLAYKMSRPMISPSVWLLLLASMLQMSSTSNSGVHIPKCALFGRCWLHGYPSTQHRMKKSHILVPHHIQGGIACKVASFLNSQIRQWLHPKGYQPFTAAGHTELKAKQPTR
eukprot:1156147-Pelagomonas_calceolata.AAC.1